MKKVILWLALLCLCSSWGLARSNMQVGAFETLIGWEKVSSRGLEGVTGINAFMGFEYKRYFTPVRNFNGTWNPYWHAGTQAIIIPFIAVGLDYHISRDWSFGGSIGIPHANIHLTYSF